jgi:carbonic anhydrase
MCDSVGSIIAWIVASDHASAHRSRSLTPAVQASAAKPGDPLGNAIRQNVINNVATLQAASPILSAAVAQQKLKVVGGIYRLADGRVDPVA